MKTSLVLAGIAMCSLFVDCGRRGSGSTVRKASALDNVRIALLREVNEHILSKGIEEKVPVDKAVYELVAHHQERVGFWVSIQGPKNRVWIVEDEKAALLSDPQDIYYKRILGVKKDGAVVATDAGLLKREFPFDGAKHFFIEPKNEK
ncbi:hypothetical protein [Prosthecobacter sp.]|uniref:hypothetical protein n=1 Tax=Prosthecobacter sp. TaxID=1965333 RepID=UPI002ABAE47E|nr:hypothetical protein [Prosthecobacter sp.]MDZ4401583.1 hypothetical protein [Prosthecobacter sp.]